MNKLFVVFVALLLSSVSVFAHDYGYREGPGYRHDHRDYRGQNIGRQIVEIGVGTAVGVVALAVAGRVAQEITGTAQQQPARVVYVVSCDRTPFVSGGLVYADQCDGYGPVVVGRIDRR